MAKKRNQASAPPEPLVPLGIDELNRRPLTTLFFLARFPRGKDHPTCLCLSHEGIDEPRDLGNIREEFLPGVGNGNRGGKA